MKAVITDDLGDIVEQKPFRPHQPYPAILYHEDGRHKRVETEEHAIPLLKAGWSKKAFPPKLEPVEQTPLEQIAELRSRVEALEGKAKKSR